MLLFKTLENPVKLIKKVLENPNKEYLEYNLPEFLKQSIKNLQENMDTILWDIYYGTLQSDINAAEVNGSITSNQAWYLRKKYLGW